MLRGLFVYSGIKLLHVGFEARSCPLKRFVCFWSRRLPHQVKQFRVPRSGFWKVGCDAGFWARVWARDLWAWYSQGQGEVGVLP